MLTKKFIQISTLGLLLAFSMLASAVEVDNAWIREAPPGAAMMGGFMTIHNPSDKDMVLVGASSKQFKNIMLHRTMEMDGVMKMMHQKEVVIPAHGMVEFKPGDYHIMMPAPKKRLVAGDKVQITLKFKSGETSTVQYTVRKDMGGMGHDMHNMHDMNDMKDEHDMHDMHEGMDHHHH